MAGPIRSSRSYNQFLGDLYRVRGELLDKAIDPDPMVPEEDCSQVLQIPMGLPGGSAACFYPTPLEQELMPEEFVLEHDDPVEEDHQLNIPATRPPYQSPG